MIFIMPLSGAVDITKSSEEKANVVVENVSNEGFTHTVLAEYASKSTCPYCPAASSQLNSIYNSGDYDFYYVTIVTDKIGELPLLAQSHLVKRLNELGVQYVPDVYFDGGYKHEQGAQPDESQYRTDIVQSGERTVPDIDLDLDVEWKVGNILKITVTVQNNEPEEYDGRLRVYITEIESRWNDAQSNPYHFAVLDIPLDGSLAVVQQNPVVQQQGQPCPLGDTYTFTKWWLGDITQDNSMVIAAVFDGDTDYAVQTASTVPTSSGAVPASKTNGNGYTNITVQEAFELYLSCLCNGIQIPIDVRTEDEWNDEHIETAPDEQNPVLWANLHAGVGLQDFMEKYADKEVVIYCQSGIRSFKATKLLVDNGFDGTIYNMLGGINAWIDAGYPTAISVHKAHDMLTSTANGIQIPIDVRTDEEWNEERIDTPEPENPVHYCLDLLQDPTGLQEFVDEYDDKEIIFYCKAGGRSNDAVDILIEKIVLNEFDGTIHNMIGGIDAWKDAGYPTPRDRSHSCFSPTSYPVFLKLLEKFPNTFPILRYLLGP